MHVLLHDLTALRHHLSTHTMAEKDFVKTEDIEEKPAVDALDWSSLQRESLKPGGFGERRGGIWCVESLLLVPHH